MSGGAGGNSIIKQLLCDASDIPFAESGSPEPVLLGSAMLGAVASESYLNLEDAMEKMSSLGEGFVPADSFTKELHAQKFQIFEALQASSRKTQGTRS